MRKIFLTSILISLVAIPTIGLALTTPTETLTETDPIAVLNRIANWLFAILLIVAAIAIIIAAFQFVTASGDPEKVGSARQFVLYAMIGVLVALLAKGLIALVLKLGLGT